MLFVVITYRFYKFDGKRKPYIFLAYTVKQYLSIPFLQKILCFFTRRNDIKYYAKHVEITVPNKENVRLASIQNAAKRTKKVNTY